MGRMQIDGRTDEAGSFRIRLPGQPRSCAVHVTIEWDECAASSRAPWPDGWFEATAGCIDDESFVRPSQGGFESRDPLP
jgi:hypothetical protein